MLKRVKARKNKSLTPNILESMSRAVTLSDRLRQAGIKECGPDGGTKTGRLSQNRKNQPKKGLTEKYNEKKKLQNLRNEFYSPYFKDCYQNKTSREKSPSKNCASFSRTLRRKIRGSAKKTIFASLDFIKDCQQYKKNFRNPKKHSEIKRERKSESVFSNHKQNFYLKKEPQKLQVNVTYSQTLFCDSVKKNEETLILDRKAREAENSSAIKDPSFFDQNTEKVNLKEESINDEGKIQSNKKVSETLSNVKPFFDEFPSGDVARIDKKYLQSLLSITNRKDNKYADESQNNEEAACEKHGQKKGKKKPNEISPENKVRIKKSEDRKEAAEEMQKDSESVQIPSYKDLILAKVLRNSTKSEAQIFVQKNNFFNQRNSEMKSEKNMAHTKPEVNDTRKNRKNRSKLLKNKNGEFSDSVFPNEISKVTDVKELWRRDIREKSENSLSSNSSCTVPKNDADPEQKNLELESYKVLKKFVEEEVKKMSNESEKKNNLKEAESTENNFKSNEFNSVNLKESEKVENICKKLQITMAENLNDDIDVIKTEMFSLKKKLAQPERYSIYEGEKINSTLLSALAEDQNGKKKLIKERGKSSEKTPSQIINNWSILNRLEQAFLALGTPNFQDKNVKDPKPLKSEKRISNEKISPDASKKDQEQLEKISKKPQKSKEVEEKKGNRDALNTLHSTPKTTTQSFRSKRLENERQQRLIKDNQQKNKFKRESKSDGSQNNTLSKITEDKKIATTQGKKKLSNQTIHENSEKKPNVRSLVKPKIIVHEPKQSGKKQYGKSPSRGCRYALGKNKEPCQKKVLVKSKNSEETLERKNTFDIIQKKDLSTVQSRKSKSCDKIDDDFEVENVKKRFTQKKNQELKKGDVFEKNKEDKPKSRDENMKNEAETKTKSFTAKKSLKIPVKNQPGSCEKDKRTEEKECFKIPEESSLKIPEDENDEEKPCENEKVIEGFPKQTLEKKILNNSSERVIKERSILSMSEKSPSPQESTRKLMQIEGKTPSNFYAPPQVLNDESSETEKSQSDSRDFLESSTEVTQQSNYSTNSSLITSSFKLTDSNSTANQNEVDIKSQKGNLLELSKVLIPLSTAGSNNEIVSTPQQVFKVERDETELKFPKRQTKMLWEKDINHYRAMVKEIMSHYNRINGFLTHSDYMQSFSTDSADLLLSMQNSTDKDPTSDKPLKMNLREYRKKIMSEYQALPIFEYKKLFHEKKEENLLTKEATKRNLMVVKDITTEMDLDVKDFQPKIHKILDSQLYVDIENLIKRNRPKIKFKEKKSSLQEIVLNKNEKMINQECLRRNSTLETFPLLHSSSVHLESSQKLKKMEGFQEDLSETITSVSLLEETESEYL